MEPISPAHLSLGEAIRSVRSAKEISQGGLALEAGLDRSYMGQIERGEKNLGITNLLKICAALKLNPSDLLSPAESLGLTSPYH